MDTIELYIVPTSVETRLACLIPARCRACRPRLRLLLHALAYFSCVLQVSLEWRRHAVAERRDALPVVDCLLKHSLGQFLS